MKMEINLNDSCLKLFPKVEKVFLFDDDVIRLMLHQILIESPERTIGLKSFGDSMCSQISFYEMPNGKVCACSYPSSVKVDYDIFRNEMRKIFKHVKDQDFSGEPYSFQLYCEKNGYARKANIV